MKEKNGREITEASNGKKIFYEEAHSLKRQAGAYYASLRGGFFQPFRVEKNNE